MAYPPKAVCVPCGREYEAGPGKTGAWFEAKASGHPYYKVVGDILVCPGCGHKLGRGFANLANEPFEEGYEQLPKTDVEITV